MPRTVAEVRIDRVQNPLVMVHHRLAQAFERLNAVLVAGRPDAPKRRALRLEERQQRVVGRLRVVCRARRLVSFIARSS